MIFSLYAGICKYNHMDVYVYVSGPIIGLYVYAYIRIHYVCM